MIRVIVLDAGPLSLVASPRRTAEVLAINRWAREQIGAGRQLVVPAIADYEVRRELIRVNRTQSLARLDAFNAAAEGRYLPLSDTAGRVFADPSPGPSPEGKGVIAHVPGGAGSGGGPGRGGGGAR